MLHKKRVLFLCIENSCRSQMAEGFLRTVAPDKFEVNSAGAIATRLNPHAVKVMAELGIDISRHWSKPDSEFAEQIFDYVITACESTTSGRCPVFRGEVTERLHWPIEDPTQAYGEEQGVLTPFRSVRD
ncbi:MAG: arsenate reductase ArsC, partial [Deltaproteobacteria bacterium]|nr:arsenate reductase ArsC [Deltaproteobacteria bacterium]